MNYLALCTEKIQSDNFTKDFKLTNKTHLTHINLPNFFYHKTLSDEQL
jgi:hypothetical protein